MLRQLFTNKLLIVSIVASFSVLASIQTSVAFFGPKSGSICSKVDEVRDIKSKKHICSKANDEKLRWLINTTPSDKQSAIGLVLSNCGSSIEGEYSVYIYPRMMFGALAERGIAEGSYKPKDERFVQFDIDQSRRITSNFEMAAALDSRWSRINRLWTSGINSAYSKWNRGGVNQIEAINSSANNLDAIEGLCKIALKLAEGEAIKERRTVSTWIGRVISEFN